MTKRWSHLDSCQIQWDGAAYRDHDGMYAGVSPSRSARISLEISCDPETAREFLEMVERRMGGRDSAECESCRAHEDCREHPEIGRACRALLEGKR